MTDVRKTAELHWNYTKGIIERVMKLCAVDDSFQIEEFIEMCHYIYVEVFIHGYKHRVGECDSK